MQFLGTALAGRYRLDRVIGDGGMAAVFAGTDLLLDRAVAVKVLHRRLAGDPAFLARFWQEAQAAAGISHPNVVGVYDFGEHDGTSFIVLELVEGELLNQLLSREGPLPPERAVAIVAGICDALQAAHARGLVHRDVKPGNVMVGPGDTVKVMDFGLARAAEVACGLTEPGTVVGTAYYIAPEQAMGRQAESRSDLYAVGVCLYELLSGERPFTGSTPAEIAIQHVSEIPRALDRLRPDLPPALVAAVHQAMAKRPEDRPPTAVALRERLREAVGGDGAAAGSVRPAGGAVTARLPVLQGSTAAPDGAPTMPPGLLDRRDDHRRRDPDPSRQRWLAAAVIALFLIAVSSAAMLSLRAEPIAGAPSGGGRGQERLVTTTPPVGETSTTRPDRGSVAAPGEHARGGAAAKPTRSKLKKEPKSDGGSQEQRGKGGKGKSRR